MSTVAQDRLGVDPSAVESFLNARKEPPWLESERRAAWQSFQELEWPDRRSEEWMRTDIRAFHLHKFALLAEAPSAPELPAGLLAEGVELGGQSITVNGHPVRHHLAEKWARQGVLFGSLEQLLAEHGELLKPHLLRHVVSPRYDRFAALTAALWAGGLLLYVPRGVHVNEPLHALSVLTPAAADLSRLLVVLEDGASATLTVETASQEESQAGLHCGIGEFIVRPGANLRLVTLQNWNQHAWHFAHQTGLVERDAALQWTVAAIGSRLSKVNQQVGLVGRGANCQVNGVLFTEGKQHINYQTLQHHSAPDCRSDFLYKAALQDKSRTVWRGMIKVDPDAQKTDGYQRNDNLLLSSQARADSIPGLEIEADDVRCTHGATSGRIDEELIFYAGCRGFTRREATRLIVTGFFQQVFDRITAESVRDALGHAIASRVREYE